MPRPSRADEAGGLYHAWNRGNSRTEIFRKEEDYAAFERILSEGLQKSDVQIRAYELMPNHWHLVLSPNESGAMSRFLRWVTATPTMRYHAHDPRRVKGTSLRGVSRVSRFRTTDTSFTVCRYVERNALRAELVTRAEEWRWGSLWRWLQRPEPSPPLLSPWPIARWVQSRFAPCKFRVALLMSGF